MSVFWLDRLILAVCVVVILLLVGSCLAIGITYNLRSTHIIITVVDKSRGSQTSGSDYLVWTECPKPFTANPEVFEVDDAFWYGHFTASDVYGQIEVGGQYRVHVIGFRWPFMSMYRDIIAVSKVE